jgi:hypothetical protein
VATPGKTIEQADFMSEIFEPRLDILPASQRLLWPELDAVPSDFVLYGGTALALQPGHRFSEDFDFFSTSGFDAARLQSRLPFFRDLARDADAWVHFKTDNLEAFVDRGGPVKVAFFGVVVSTRYAACRTRFAPRDRSCGWRRWSIWPG